MEPLGGKDVGFDQLEDRHQRETCCANLVGQQFALISGDDFSYLGYHAQGGVGLIIGRECDKGVTSEDAAHIAGMDPTTVLALLDRLEAAEAAVERVREMHRELRNSGSALYPDPLCECGDRWPCPTITALDGDAP